MRPVIAKGLASFDLHKLAAAPDRGRFLASIAPVRAMG
jgi:hypothetical protein